jgi:prevent-host-death family protein
MTKEKTMTFVQARSKLSEIVDRVAKHDEAYIVTKRNKPRAVIIGIDQYQHLAGTSNNFKTVQGKRIMSIGGIATAVGDIDEAIRELRRSRVEAISRNHP